MPAYLENTTVAPGLENVSFIPIPEKHNAKECSIYCITSLIHRLAKYCSKFSKPGFNITLTENFQIFKLDLGKVEETNIKMPTSTGSSKKQQSYRKTSTSASLSMLNPLTVWITTNCGKLFRRWEYRSPYLLPEKPVYRSRSNN